MENNNTNPKADPWVKATERYSIQSFHNRMESLTWNRVADDLAFALDWLSDDPNNVKAWFKAHDALKAYNEALNEKQRKANSKK